ncbi:MAG: AbrB/MazE/SpoVT family DNA-binding domain-containing protein [Acidobacteria bacterium]|nr:AbrB/MazE/SpoVT family DNA-binding domain-containing protein [Acidobacteriota bacterium]
MTTVEVIGVGDGLGIILPPESLKHPNVEVGDTLYVTVKPNGIHLSAIEPKTLEAMNRVMYKNRDVLKRLADS